MQVLVPVGADLVAVLRGWKAAELVFHLDCRSRAGSRGGGIG